MSLSPFEINLGIFCYKVSIHTFALDGSEQTTPFDSVGRGRVFEADVHPVVSGDRNRLLDHDASQFFP